MAHQLSRVCLNPKIPTPPAKLACFTPLGYFFFWGGGWLFEADMAVSSTTSHAPAHSVWVAVTKLRYHAWIKKDGGIGITHSCLVSVAKGEMPSLLSCLSYKLAIMGWGLRVNSVLPFFLFFLFFFFPPWLLMRAG